MGVPLPREVSGQGAVLLPRKLFLNFGKWAIFVKKIFVFMQKRMAASPSTPPPPISPLLSFNFVNVYSNSCRVHV